jgi:hypothetical protein
MHQKKTFEITQYAVSSHQGGKLLVVEGKKLPPPSMRITLKQSKITVLNAKVFYKHKKSDIECEVKRINRIKSFGEVRLHTYSLLYPGNYRIEVSFEGELDEELLKQGIL